MSGRRAITPAGETPISWDDGPLPEWPAGGLDLSERRLPGWEHVDRTEADRVTAVLGAKGLGPDADPLPWSSEAEAYPTGSPSAAMNAHLGGPDGRVL